MNLFHWNIIHVSGGYSPNHMKLIEGVERNSELLQIGDLDSDRLVGRHIAYLQVEDISALLVKIPIGCLSAFFYGCLILQLCFFLFFDHPLDSGCPKLCDKFVDTSTGIDGEAILHLKKLMGRVVVLLREGDARDSIRDVNIVEGS